MKKAGYFLIVIILMCCCFFLGTKFFEKDFKLVTSNTSAPVNTTTTSEAFTENDSNMFLELEKNYNVLLLVTQWKFSKEERDFIRIYDLNQRMDVPIGFFFENGYAADIEFYSEDKMFAVAYEERPEKDNTLFRYSKESNFKISIGTDLEKRTYVIDKDYDWFERYGMLFTRGHLETFGTKEDEKCLYVFTTWENLMSLRNNDTESLNNGSVKLFLE